MKPTDEFLDDMATLLINRLNAIADLEIPTKTPAKELPPPTEEPFWPIVELTTRRRIQK